METKSKQYSYGDGQLRDTIEAMPYRGVYMPLVVPNGDIGLISPSGARLRVAVSQGNVEVALLNEEKAEEHALDNFFHGLDRSLAWEYGGAEIKKTPVAPAEVAAPAVVPVASAETQVAHSGLPAMFGSMTAFARRWAATVLASVRAIPRLVRWGVASLLAVAVLAGACGIGFRYGYDSRNPVRQVEYINMEKRKNDEIKRLSEQNEVLKTQNSSQREQIDSLSQFKNEYDQKQSELDQRQSALDQRQSELDKRSSDLDARENAVKQQESAASSTAQSEQTYSYDGASGSTASQTGGSSYYKNCSAARAAGAAPLHRGDPGYRAALDRDGDGIACEWS